LKECFRQIKAVYMKRGFRIVFSHMDGQFEPLRPTLAEMQIALNTASQDEHVAEIERFIQTLKGRCRSTYCSLPWKRMPRRITIELVYAMTFWLNVFPKKNGVSDTLSPRAIITGQDLDFNKHCVLEFGEYVQTHEISDNTMRPRTIGAIALRPTGNAQGGYYFMSLNTGRRIN